jgi:rhamnogalacturonan endolyase
MSPLSPFVAQRSMPALEVPVHEVLVCPPRPYLKESAMPTRTAVPSAAAVALAIAAWIPAHAAVTATVFEAETVAGPVSSWLTNRTSKTHWNLWSTDKDAAKKWSGGVVLQSPVVTADRASPEDGAPPLHVRIPGLADGLYDVQLKGGRSFGISFDGRTWARSTGGTVAESLAVTGGVFEMWFDDRFVDTKNPGTCYLDTITLSPTPPPIVKPKVEGHARARTDETLDRGVVALPCEAGVYVGWRLLRSDPAGVAFHVYRATGGGEPQRVTREPIARTTDFIDDCAPAHTGLVYTVRAVIGGTEQPAGGGGARVQVDPDAERTGRVTIKLRDPIRFQKCGVGDLDGDGRYDFVLKSPADNIDPYVKYWKPSPDTYKLDAYRSDGTWLWHHDLGWAIERGIWYSPYIVHDLDGDGRAEVAAKIGEGDPRDPDGRVRKGAEWVVVWDGATGRELARAPWPDRSGFGDDERGYNYASRNQLAVAYLDGKTPCLVVLRGTYTVMKAEAWDFDGKGLRKLWAYTSDESGPRYRGQGAHTTRCGDIDGDGRDEVLLGSVVLDDTGVPLWCTRLGHPDHFYVGDLMPQRPGIEIYYGIESRQPSNGLCMVDAPTGRILWGWNGPTKHIHATGLCADICPLHPGAESYGADSADHKPTGDRWLFASDGTVLRRDLDLGFGKNTVHWDADLQREIVMGDWIADFDGGRHEPRIEGKGTVLVADILGDWREELIVTETGELRIYTTTIPAMDRRVTLMQDRGYRSDVAMTAMGYTVPPTPSSDFESAAPNLNLTALAAKPGTVRVVAVAPRDAPLEGDVKLSAEPGAVAPAVLAVRLAPGERKAWECAVTRADGAKSVRVRGELVHSSGTLRGAVRVP